MQIKIFTLFIICINFIKANGQIDKIGNYQLKSIRIISQPIQSIHNCKTTDSCLYHLLKFYDKKTMKLLFIIEQYNLGMDTIFMNQLCNKKNCKQGNYLLEEYFFQPSIGHYTVIIRELFENFDLGPPKFYNFLDSVVKANDIPKLTLTEAQNIYNEIYNRKQKRQALLFKMFRSLELCTREARIS